jgi:hypothetical protein
LAEVDAFQLRGVNVRILRRHSGADQTEIGGALAANSGEFEREKRRFTTEHTEITEV